MTEGEKAFYRRRAREEMACARNIDCAKAKELHLQWAQFFQHRLNGRRMRPPEPVSYR